jgi:hypothetical protein
MTDFILTRSDQGDGGWSLHAPGSTDEDIATGDASALVTGVSRKRAGEWLRPNARDYTDAARAYAREIEAA